MKKFWILPLATGLGVGLVGCDPRERDAWELDPPVRFDTVDAVIETADDVVRLRVELAATSDQRAYGMMQRPSLAPEQGMLFTYPTVQDPTSGFWMFRTLIPLDIAFLDQAGEIVAIRQMEPCDSPNPQLCPIYRAGVPYSAALEVNRGFFERWGVQVGDRVRVQEEAGASS